MRFTRLHLENFRGFEKLNLELEDDLTVLVGINGSGKTTILDSIELAVGDIGSSLPRPIAARDRRESKSARIALQVSGRGSLTELSCGTAVPEPDPQREKLSRAFRGGGIPIFCYYKVSRNAVDATPGSTNPGRWDQLRAWENTDVTFKSFFHWFREREDLENEDRRANPEHRDLQLEAVRQAIATTLPGYREPRVRRPRFDTADQGAIPEFVLEKDGQTLSFSQLSTGERTLAALVADIARRAAIAGPEEPPLQAQGVVLIDEIELHLHPQWQAEILGRLRTTFPNLQFIVATHSPIVLGRVEDRCVRILENFQLVAPGAPTRGRDPNALLTEIFNVPLRDPHIQEQIAAIADLIDAERLDEAREQLKALGEELGGQDAEYVRLQAMVELLSA